MKTLILSIIFMAFPIGLMSQLNWRKIEDIPHHFSHDIFIRLSNGDLMTYDYLLKIGFRKSTDGGKTWKSKNMIHGAKDNYSLLNRETYGFKSITEFSNGFIIAQQDTHWVYSMDRGETWNTCYGKYGQCEFYNYDKYIICFPSYNNARYICNFNSETTQFEAMKLPPSSDRTPYTGFNNFILSDHKGDSTLVYNLDSGTHEIYPSMGFGVKYLFADSASVYAFYPTKTYVTRDTCKSWELYNNFGYDSLITNNIRIKKNDINVFKEIDGRLFLQSRDFVLVSKDFGLHWKVHKLNGNKLEFKTNYPYYYEGTDIYEYNFATDEFEYTGEFKLSYTTHYREFGDTLVSENKIKYPGKEWEDLNLNRSLGFNKERYVIENQNILKYTLDNPQPKLLGTLNFKPKSDKIELRPSVNNNKLQSFPLIESESGFGRGTSIPPNGVAYIHIITPDTLLKTYQYKPEYRVNVDDFEIDINGTALFNQYNSEEEAYEICAVNLNTQKKQIGFKQTYDEAIYIHANNIKVEGDVICFNYRYTDRDYGHHEVPKFSLNGGETWQTLGTYKLDALDFEIYNGEIYISGYNGVYIREDDESYTNLMDNLDISDFLVNKIEIDPKHRIYAYTTKGVYISDPIIVSVEDNSRSGSSDLNSSLIYPNPSTNSADIAFALDDAEEIKIMIYDNSGRLVETLHSGLLEAGEHTFSWNCANVSSGKYICNIRGNSVFKSLKVVVAR